MTNFIETSKSRNAKRTCPAIADVAPFAETVANFAADSTVGLTRKEKSAETYKTKITYFNAKSEEAGYLNLYLADKTAYEDMAGFLAGNRSCTKAGFRDSEKLLERQ